MVCRRAACAGLALGVVASLGLCFGPGLEVAWADEHKVAVNVRVSQGLRLDASDLSRVVRAHLGRYGGVVALPESKTKDAIAEERASTNSKCRSGVLDEKCQLALGSALAASHWLEVIVSRPGRMCELSLEYLSIVRESSDGGDIVRVGCDRESVALGLERGVGTIARKARWDGAAGSPSAGASQPIDAATTRPPGEQPATSADRTSGAESAPSTAEGASAGREPMVLVPAGDFPYGCSRRTDPQCDGGESPVQWVTLEAFRIDVTEVTVAAYRACVRARRCSEPGSTGACNWDTGRDDHPVNCVDWFQARAYCEWKGKRLPTEQEWEKAARGSEGRIYPWGRDEPGATRANLRGAPDGWAQTSPVGTFSTGLSPYGAADMSGNVWEWCDADTAATRLAVGADGPKRAMRGPARTEALRGGSWFDLPRFARAAGRSRGEVGKRSEGVGFRCAESVPTP